jgi:AraC-like DNA-binding protein
MRQKTMESVARLAKNLPTPENYFMGVLPSSMEMPRNILVFNRRRAEDLGKDFYYHFRFVLMVNLKVPGKVMVDEKVFEFKPGEAIFVFPHQFHHYLEPKSKSILWFFITFELDKSDWLSALKYQKVRLSETSLTYLRLLIRNYIDTMTSYSSLHNQVAHLTALILHELLHQKKRKKGSGSGFQLSMVEEVNRFIWDNLDKNLSIADLASKFCYSDSRLRTLYREKTGISLGRYIQETKISRASSLLVKPGYNISQIAHACGYQSVYAFSLSFKKRIGMSPLTYRKMQVKRYKLFEIKGK